MTEMRMLMGVAVKMLSDSSVINHNFKAQEFQTRTLSPGQKTEGFLYFQLPEKATLPDRWSIRVEVSELPGQQKRQFIFTFGQEEGRAR